jgi:hypothetical protein
MALTEGKVPSDWLVWEVDDAKLAFCREQVTILAGSGADRVLTTGMVMGKITTGGKYVQFNDTASNGSEVAAGILVLDVTAVNGTDNPNGVVLVRGPAAVKKQGLVWPATADAGEKAAAIVVLEAAGIQMREAV